MLPLAVAVILQSPHSLGQRTLTWQGATIVETKSFLLTEAGMSLVLSQNEAPTAAGGGDIHFEGELGWMCNLDSKYALGGSGYLSLDDDGSRIGVKIRGRRWLSSKTSLDLGVGPTLYQTGGWFEDSPGFVGSLGVFHRDIIGFVLTAEILPYKAVIAYGGDQPPPTINEGTETSFYAGLRFGSYPGGAICVIAPISVLLYTLATLSD